MNVTRMCYMKSVWRNYEVFFALVHQFYHWYIIFTAPPFLMSINFGLF